MKYYLSSFGLHNPYIQIDFADHLVYPVAIECKNGFDLDYGLLLVGESFVIDEMAYDFIIEDKRGFLSPMANSLKRLKSEGLLELFDLQTLVNKNQSELKAKTNILSDQFGLWLETLRGQWNILETTRANFVTTYGDQGKDIINGNHFTLVNAIHQVYGKVSQKEIDRFHKTIFSKRNSFNKDEILVLKELIKPLVCHILIHDLVRHQTNLTILDWDDGAPYYDKLYSTRWNRSPVEENIPQQSRKIFNLLIPQVKPNMIDVLIKFLQDNKASSSLRTQIIHSIEHGVELDINWMSQYQKELIKHQLKKEKVMKKVRLGSSILGLLIPGSSLATDVFVEGATMLGEDGIDQSISRNNFDWYYAMQDIVETKK